MGYSQALEEQISMRNRWAAYIKQGAPDDGDREIDQMLSFGDPYFWAKSLCGVIETAAVDLPLSWRWYRELLPTYSGFIWFEQPLVFSGNEAQGQHGRVMPALAWDRFQDTDTDDTAVAVCPLFWRTDRRPWPSMVFALKHGQTLQERMEQLISGACSYEHDILVWASRMFGACLTFLEQRILIAPQHRADRAARRRVERQGYTHEPLVRVVELRRKQTRSEDHGESEPVEWSHQWIVSAHWRNQWYPSLNDYQPRWIMPYVKGPEDKPLKPPRAKVFAVVR